MGVNVADTEVATGYTFFTNLARDVQQAFKSRIAPVPMSWRAAVLFLPYCQGEV